MLGGDINNDLPLQHVTVITCFSLLLVEIFFGVIANILMMLVVYLNKSLRTAINALVVNLSVSGLFISLLNVPLILLILTNSNSVPKSVYSTQVFIHIICGAVQLITFVAISYERHQAIAKPFDKLQRVKRAKISIPASWCVGILAALLSHFFLDDYLLYNLLGMKNELNISSSFEALILVPMSLTAILSIIAIYITIIVLLRRHVEKKKKKLGLFSMNKNKVVPSSDAASHIGTTSVSVIADNRIDIKADNPVQMDYLQVPDPRAGNSQHKVSLKQAKAEESANSTSVHTFSSTLDDQQQFPISESLRGDRISQPTPPQKTGKGKEALNHIDEPGLLPGSTTTQATDNKAVKSDSRVIDVYDMNGTKTQTSTTNDVTGAICVMNPANKEQGKRRVEAKTAKITACVISSYLFFWMPYPVSILVSYTSHFDSLHIKLNAYMICMSLSLLAAAFNPILYGLINKSINTEIKKQLNKVRKAFSRT